MPKAPFINPEDPLAEECEAAMANIYKKQFNIYQCLNRLKKKLKLLEGFPAQAIIWTCESYEKRREPPDNHWTWFVEVFKCNSERYFSEKHENLSKSQDKRGGFAKSIRQIMKEIK